MKRWILQANPKHYDIDSALVELSEILWRVPQYTDEIRRGDEVLMWRSGSDAGVIGVGTVAEGPALASVSAVERPFVLDTSAEGGAETRVLISVRPVDLIGKQTVINDLGLGDHLIVRAPMGTVFRVADAEWDLFESVLSARPPALPAAAEVADELPSPFGWKDRRKDAYPLPGGYDAYLDSLSTTLDFVRRKRPSVDELAAELQLSFDSSPTNARYIGLFLRRGGFLEEAAGLLELSDTSMRFIESRDSRLAIAQLHARVRFVGEMLAVLDRPREISEVMVEANQNFGMGWTTKAQIQRRRGWLQSAGMIEVDEQGKLARTPAGTKLLGELVLHSPQTVESDAAVPLEQNVSQRQVVVDNAEPIPNPGSEVLELIDRLNQTSILSSSPDDFEFTIRDVFQFLGFRAEKLGGAGKTDVVADADLGKDASYRIIIDGKTTARGAVADHQIDWDTIDDHRAMHAADYVVIAGPAFGGGRLSSRAAGHNAVLMTADDLGDLVRLHAAVPLPLDAYRPLFAAEGGDADLEALNESVEERERLTEIVGAVLREVEVHSNEVGALSSRDLFLLLRNSTDLDAEEAEIATALEALASPLIAALKQEVDRFRLSGPLETATRRLELLTQLLNET